MPYDRVIDIYWDNDRIDLDYAYEHLGVRAILCEATQGTMVPSSAADKAWYPKWKKWALQKGVAWAAFHLTNGDEPQKQLEHFLSVEDGMSDKIGLAIDWERARDHTLLDLGQPHPLKDYYSDPSKAEEVKQTFNFYLNSPKSKATRAGHAYDPEELAISPKEVFEASGLQAVTDDTP